MIWLLINHRMNKLNHWNQTMLHFLIVLYRYVLKSKFLMEKIKIHLQPIWNLNKVSWAEYKNLTITSTWTRMPTLMWSRIQNQSLRFIGTQLQSDTKKAYICVKQHRATLILCIRSTFNKLEYIVSKLTLFNLKFY